MAIDRARLRAAIDDEVEDYLDRKGAELVEVAQDIYLSQRVLPHHNEYLNSFDVENAGGWTIRISNSDREAWWVEFGAHAGGKTYVLGYAPLRRAIDTMSA